MQLYLQFKKKNMREKTFVNLDPVEKFMYFQKGLKILELKKGNW